MAHQMTIHNLGPIRDCALELRDFTVLSGPQSNGKSTIAKAVYFFRTVKQDILQIMMQGGPKNATGLSNTTWNMTLKARMRDKFLQLFGTSWVMPPDMELVYHYDSKNDIRVFLVNGKNQTERNYIDFAFSQHLQDYLADLEEHSFLDLLPRQRESEKTHLDRLFDDPYETVFIPAGRNLITLLSTQLNYIFTSLEGSQLRNIDYVTKRYTELILMLKPYFQNGMEAVWDNVRSDAEKAAKKRKVGPSINLLLNIANQVLQGSYKYVDGEERLYLDGTNYVKINLSSSGQQEVVWIFNLLFYYLLEEKKIFLILEEPESHLYPESQRLIAEVLSLFANNDKQILVTTHSPYVLGTFNYLLIAAQCPEQHQAALSKKIHKRMWLNPQKTGAYFIRNGSLDDILEAEDGLTLIKNEVIDGASAEINARADMALELLETEEL